MIIMYHYVRSESAFDVGVNNFYDFEVFQKDIIKLRASDKSFPNPSSLSKDQWISVSKDPDTIILTFDDGYIDHSQLVAPFLDSLGIKGVFFVP